MYTFISRIFGLVRDLLIAANFGAGLYADAFNVAFKLPNFFRSIFAEGAFSSAFVPLFSGKLIGEEKEKALDFASNALTILTLSVTGLVALFEVIMPLVILMLAPGFEDDLYKTELTIYLTRITTPYLIFISIVTFFSCVLSAFDKFAANAASPIILNLAMIIALYFYQDNPAQTAIMLAWSVFIGGVLQLVVIYTTVKKRKIQLKFKLPTINADIKKLFRNMTPAVIGSGVSQINLWIGTIIATSIPGAVSLIYYADRLTQLPLALIGVSIGIVILPTLSKQAKSGKMEKYIHTQNRAIEISLLFSLPCTIALLVIAEPIIYILFQHGAFNAQDTVNTTFALTTLSLGIPAYILNKILIPAFFAVEDTKTPVRISVFCLILNTIGNLVLINYLAQAGITLSTAITAWINIILLFYFAIRKQIFFFDDLIRKKILRLVLSGFCMYWYLDSIYGLLYKYIYSTDKLASIGSFILIIFSAALVYFAAIFVTRSYTIDELKNLYHIKGE
jgi:putative peptidoglycan lipid II flippase